MTGPATDGQPGETPAGTTPAAPPMSPLTRAALVIGTIALVAYLLGGRGIATVLLFVVVIGVLVLVHELGHFLTAKAANVRVLEFGFGFPPRARVLRQAGETLVTLNWLPIGGFVRLDGEDGNAKDDPRLFSAKPLIVRLWILVAGVLMNVVLAFVIFVGIAWLATPYVGVTVPEVQADSPASRAGIVAGDAILKVNGQGFDLYGEDILTGIRDHIGQTVTLTIRHADGSISDVPVPLRSQAQIDATHGPLGINGPQSDPFQTVFFNEYRSRPLGDALGIGASELRRWSGLIFAGLGDLASGFVQNPTTPPPVAGPVGIAVQIGDIFFGAGPIMTLYVVGLLSINLAVVNILPFPPLDGGRMLLLIIRKLAGNRVGLRAERVTIAVGFTIMIAFVLWVTAFDVARQLGGTP